MPAKGKHIIIVEYKKQGKVQMLPVRDGGCQEQQEGQTEMHPHHQRPPEISLSHTDYPAADLSQEGTLNSDYRK